MPPALQYVPPNDTRRNSLLGIGGTEHRERTEAYNKAYKYYSGKQPQQLDQKPNEPDDNVVINVTQQAIDRTVSFLFPAVPKFETDPDATSETPQETWLKSVFEENGGISFLHEMAMNGSLSGDVYVRLMPKDEEFPFPQAILVDPTTIQPFWQADDIRRVLWYELHWSVTDFDTVGHSKAIEYIIDFVKVTPVQWAVVQYQNITGSAQGWEIQQDKSYMWNLAVPPIIHWKHLPNPGKFYGRSEATHLDLNDKLNLLASENNRIIRYHSAPHTVATGVSAEKIVPTAIESLWAIENDAAKVYNLEMKSELEAARAQQAILHDAYLAQSRVVILQGEVKDFQRVTNAGVRTVFIDMLSKNTILRWNYGRGLQQVARGLFLLGGFGDIVPDIMHADPLPVDDMERATIAQLERAMNIVSRQTISTKRGYNWDIEKTKMEQESKLEFLQPPAPLMGQPKPGQNDPSKKPVPPKED